LPGRSSPRRRSRLRALASLLIVLSLAGCALAVRPALTEVATPSRADFDPTLVRQGARLAALGDCLGCHTTRTGGVFAGGVPVRTQFGTVYSTNITPDRATGIGAWSEDAFRRALREGVSRDGHLLYPAFPYDHYTQLQDGDIHALYAYVMTRTPLHAVAPANKLVFPLQFRPLIAAWNALYLRPGPRAPDPAQDAEWNRGAYLVDALAHCGSCHTPRNHLGAEEDQRAFAGGEVDGWIGTALDRDAPSPVPWSRAALAAYLRTGLVEAHAMSAGPMQGVVRSLSEADAADVQAIAAYMHAQMQPPPPGQAAREQAARARAQEPVPIDVQPGARLYADNCASCHDEGRGLSSNSALHLSLAVALYLPDARNLLHIVRGGIQPVAGGGADGRWMPSFEGTLDDAQLATLAAWLRQDVAGQPAWPHLQADVRATREPKS
jgi:mono/diheme cytochrome c family protein